MRSQSKTELKDQKKTYFKRLNENESKVFVSRDQNQKSNNYSSPKLTPFLYLLETGIHLQITSETSGL